MESQEHILLCKKLKEDFLKYINISENGSWSSGTVAFHCLPNTTKINGFIPDLKYVDKKNLIAIGDAKNRNDIKNKHTAVQIRAYLKTAHAFKKRLMFFRVPSIAFTKTVNFIFNSIDKLDKQVEFYVNGKKI